jgi:hypothetical protein
MLWGKNSVKMTKGGGVALTLEGTERAASSAAFFSRLTAAHQQLIISNLSMGSFLEGVGWGGGRLSNL